MIHSLDHGHPTIGYISVKHVYTYIVIFHADVKSLPLPIKVMSLVLAYILEKVGIIAPL